MMYSMEGEGGRQNSRVKKCPEKNVNHEIYFRVSFCLCLITILFISRKQDVLNLEFQLYGGSDVNYAQIH